MPRPTFSIVIPTRHRPHLLKYALQSALEQQTNDFEILVSDNSTDRRAESVVRRIGDGPVRYVTTDSDLNMPESWEFALDHARGRYITYLPDDDAILPSLLGEVATVLSNAPSQEVIMWSNATYFHASWFREEDRNRLRVPMWTSEVRECESFAHLQDLFRFGSRRQPLMLNSACSRECLDMIRGKVGRVFFPPAPDYSFAACALACTASFTHLDMPLVVGGAGQESVGISHLHGDFRAIGTFLEEFRGQAVLDKVPLPLVTERNIVAQTLLNIRETGVVPGVDLDMEAYLLANVRQLKSWARNGVDVRTAMRMAKDVASERSDAVIRSVARELRGEWLRGTIRRRLIKSDALSRVESILLRHRRRPDASATTFDGSAHGFQNILESARFCASLVRNAVP